MRRSVCCCPCGKPWVRQSELWMNCTASIVEILTSSDVFMDAVNRKTCMKMMVPSTTSVMLIYRSMRQLNRKENNSS